MEPQSIEITGKNLTIRDVSGFVCNPQATVRLADAAREAVRKSKAFLDERLDKEVIYGVNTGFGPMASRVIDHEHLEELQYNLVRSHAVGMGEPLPEEYVLAAMLVRLNTLAKGYSGVSLGLIDELEAFINKRIVPVIPEHGAVGASGDLVQLAHIALALIGEGEVTHDGMRQPTSRALHVLGLRPHALEPKEGLALINGTSVMTGIAALMCLHAQQLLALAVKSGALGLELVGGFGDSLSKKLHFLRPHEGQIMIAKSLRRLLASSRLLRGRNHTFPFSKISNGEDIQRLTETVQEVYSLRCIPQILGPVFDTLKKTWREVEIEMNSATDNPLADWELARFLHGGNFHGDYIAHGVDQLKASLVKLTLLSERRVNFFLNENVNKRFPSFLNLKTPGLTLALQGLQFVATSTAAQSQSLAFPHAVHSIPTNADNQDVVSMGVDAALFGMKVVENAYVVLAIELLTLAQAVDYLEVIEQLSDPSRLLVTQVRQISPKIENDRVLVKELPRLVQLLKESSGWDMEWQFGKPGGTTATLEKREG